MRFIGLVTRRPFATGSKSERDAIFLETDAGEFVLRRVGGNPFETGDLAEFVGHRVEVEGSPVGYTLLAREIAIRDAEPPDESRSTGS